MNNKVVADFYVVIEPRRTWRTGPITKARAIDLRVNKPNVPRGCVAVRVKLAFEASALEEWAPIVEADVEPHQFVAPEIEVAEPTP